MYLNFPNRIFNKKINHLGTIVLATVLGVFCLAFTSSESEKNAFDNSFLLANSSDSEISFNTMAGPNDTVDLALVLTTPNTFSCPGNQVNFTIEI